MNIVNRLGKKMIIAILIVLIIAVGYLAVCKKATGKDFLTNTTINGIDVSNMTVDEAKEAVEKQFKEDKSDLSIYLKADDDHTYQVSLKKNAEMDSSEVESISKKLTGNFLARGINYFTESKQYVEVKVKDEKKLTKAIKNSGVLDYDTRKPTSYTFTEKTITFTKGQSGKYVPEDEVNSAVDEALNTYQFKDPITCKVVDHKLDSDEMDEIYEELSHGAADATLDPDNDYEIVDSRDGAVYDLDEAKSLYKETSAGGSFTLDAEVTLPKISKEDLEENLFKDTLGSYSTYVSGTATRISNVKLAGSKCNGVILLPGESFSYNDVVGERTKEAGFGAAPAYNNGETVDELGGGVCQVSSTLYNAVVYANLKVTDRTNHTYKSTYTNPGQDATVSWGGPDFKFENNTDYPIKIVESFSGGRIYFKILGTNLDGHYVKFTYEVLGSVAPQITYKNDNTLAEGKEVVEEEGTYGCKVQTYRKVYSKEGKLISSSKEAYSYYKGHKRVIRKGTKKTTKKETKTEETEETEDTKKTEETSTDTTN